MLTFKKEKQEYSLLLQIDWLDRLTFIEVEKINQKEKLSSNQLFLMIEFPQVKDYIAFQIYVGSTNIYLV
jgi:hypothetical protein